MNWKSSLLTTTLLEYCCVNTTPSFELVFQPYNSSFRHKKRPTFSCTVHKVEETTWRDIKLAVTNNIHWNVTQTWILTWRLSATDQLQVATVDNNQNRSIRVQFSINTSPSKHHSILQFGTDITCQKCCMPLKN